MDYELGKGKSTSLEKDTVALDSPEEHWEPRDKSGPHRESTTYLGIWKLQSHLLA